MKIYAPAWQRRIHSSRIVARLAATFFLLLMVLGVPSIAFSPAGDDGNRNPRAMKDTKAVSTPAPEKDSNHALIEQLLQEINALNARVAELESRRTVSSASSVDGSPSASSTPAADAAAGTNIASSAVVPVPLSASLTRSPNGEASPASPSPTESDGMHMDLPGGPRLNTHNFLDFHLDAGSAVNPSPGPEGTTLHEPVKLVSPLLTQEQPSGITS